VYARGRPKEAIVSWWDKIRGRSGGKKSGAGAAQAETPGPAQWLGAEATSFGFPVLDVISITGTLISTTQNPDLAEMSVSWGRKTVSDLDRRFQAAETIACSLRYPAEADLPDGWLYVPPAMEQKWVIAYLEGRVFAARSWTGEVKVAADAKHTGNEIVIERVELADDSFRTFGEPVQVFDWLLRSHALGQTWPLPCTGETIQMIESVPLSVFSLFGNVAAYAATSWAPPPPRRPLRATSAVVTAVRLEQPDRLNALAAAGQSLNARSAMGGYTALHIAAIKGNLELTRQLLELGADPNVLADRNASVVITAIVHKAPLPLLELLAAHGADVAVPNQDGFGALHALAEINDPTPLAWLLGRGLDVEQRTHNGHTPLQIAAALGHVEALRALLEAGASPSTRSGQGETARDIATAQGKTEAVKALDAWSGKA
jgi:hypothetical protein